MTETDRSAAENPAGGAEALSELAASARGWHRIQLAVLGFIGFCGVLWGNEGSAGPAAVQWLAGALVVLAFLLACMAIYLVGRVAYPFYGPGQTAEMVDEPTMARRTRRLRTGIFGTYLAVAMLVAATLSAWWPAPPDNGAVVVSDAAGRTLCGHLLQGPAGEIRLATAGGTVTIPLHRVALLRPVGDC